MHHGGMRSVTVDIMCGKSEMQRFWRFWRPWTKQQMCHLWANNMITLYCTIGITLHCTDGVTW